MSKSLSQPAKVIPLRSGPAELPQRSDDELMLLSAAGRRDAFAELARRYLDRLVRFCAKYTGSVATGDDLAQDVLVRLWSVKDRYRPAGRFEVFLFTLARNACRSHRRFAFLRAAPPPEDAAADLAAGPLDEVIARESERRVRAALLQLPARLREAVLLRFDQELGYAAVAEVLEIPEPTARTRVFNGIRKLRSLLEGAER